MFHNHKLWSCSLWSLLHSKFLSFLCPNIRLRNNVRDHVWQPYTFTNSDVDKYKWTTDHKLLAFAGRFSLVSLHGECQMSCRCILWASGIDLGWILFLLCWHCFSAWNIPREDNSKLWISDFVDVMLVLQFVTGSLLCGARWQMKQSPLVPSQCK